MIELYTWPTPNGHKVHIMLEETGTPYNVHPIDIGAGDQFKPEFLNRVDDIVIFKPLTRREIERIVDLQVTELRRRLAERDLGLELTSVMREALMRGADAVAGVINIKLRRGMAGAFHQWRPGAGVACFEFAQFGTAQKGSRHDRIVTVSRLIRSGSAARTRQQQTMRKAGR